MIDASLSRTSTLLKYFVVAGTLAFCGGAYADVGALVENCAGCHGKDGVSADPGIPIIGGYSAAYLQGSLANYKNKARPCPQVKYLEGTLKGQGGDMCAVASKLSDADMTAIADYLSKKPFVRAGQSSDAGKAEAGKKIHEANCFKCHEDGGSSADDDAGILAGQWMQYIRHTFEEFGSGERPLPKKMKPKFDELTKEQIDQLVNYYGSFK